MLHSAHLKATKSPMKDKSEQSASLCREDSVKDEGRILSSISSKFISPVNKETVGAQGA
jgi:hypothetical protein